MRKKDPTAGTKNTIPVFRIRGKPPDLGIQSLPRPKLPSEKRAAQSHERHYLTIEEVRELAEVIDQRFTSMIAVLAFLGLRIGELAGLTVGQVNTSKRRIRIDRQTTVVGGRLVRALPKWGMSRTISYPKALDGVFQKHTAGKSRTQLAFTAARGGYIRSDDWRSDYLDPAIAEATRRRSAQAEKEGTAFNPFPPIRTHDLRHTAASFAISSGANVKAVQNMLGHKDASMTLNTYADLFDEDQERVAAAMDPIVRSAGDVAFWLSDTPPEAVLDTKIRPLPEALPGSTDGVESEAA